MKPCAFTTSHLSSEARGLKPSHFGSVWASCCMGSRGCCFLIACQPNFLLGEKLWSVPCNHFLLLLHSQMPWSHPRWGASPQYYYCSDFCCHCHSQLGVYHFKLVFNVSSVVEQWTGDWKILGSSSSTSGRRNVFSRVNFLCWLLFLYPFHPMLLQQHITDPGHSAKCAAGKLQINTHAFYICGLR